MEPFCKIRYLILETEWLPSHVWSGLPFYVWKIPPVFCCSSVFGSWGQSKQRYQTSLSPGHLFKCNLWFCKCAPAADTLLQSLSKSWLSICRMLIGCQVHRELWKKKFKDQKIQFEKHRQWLQWSVFIVINAQFQFSFLNVIILLGDRPTTTRLPTDRL